MTATRRTRLSPEARRSQILTATEHIVLRRGAADLTMEDIAAEAGVTAPLLYHYFKTRDALLGAMLDAALARFDDEVLGLMDGASTFEAKVRVLCRQALEPLPAMRVTEALAGRAADSELLRSRLDRHALKVGLLAVQLICDEHDLDEGAAVMVAASILGSTSAFAITMRATKWAADDAEDFLVDLCQAAIRCAVQRYGRRPT